MHFVLLFRHINSRHVFTMDNLIAWIGWCACVSPSGALINLIIIRCMCICWICVEKLCKVLRCWPRNGVWLLQVHTRAPSTCSPEQQFFSLSSKWYTTTYIFYLKLTLSSPSFHIATLFSFVLREIICEFPFLFVLITIKSINHSKHSTQKKTYTKTDVIKSWNNQQLLLILFFLNLMTHYNLKSSNFNVTFKIWPVFKQNYFVFIPDLCVCLSFFRFQTTRHENPCRSFCSTHRKWR